uniref:Uncharacterized protein n=1 Tax=Rhizophora mucronata TaxID=61149 RepID=A0A2P2JJ90_RHIMU
MDSSFSYYSYHINQRFFDYDNTRNRIIQAL